MAGRTLRQKPRISYYEPEEPSLDEYIFCDQCADFVFEYCAIHGPLLVIPDDKIASKPNFPSFVPRAALTIPHVFLHLAPSIIPGAGLGVFSTLTLPRGVRFGPYRGIRTQEVDSMYCWQIYDRNNKRSHVVDAADGNRSNWMRYVNCARHWCEQNLLAYQYKGELYYRTIKIIPRYTELMVFYGSEFANALHVNLSKYNSPPGYAQKFGVPAAKKPRLDIQKHIDKVPDETVSTKNKKIGQRDKKNNYKNNVVRSVPDSKKTIIDKSISIQKNTNVDNKETLQDLKNCERTVVNVNEEEYKCKICNYKGIDSDGIKKHSLNHRDTSCSEKPVVHDTSMKKPYSCDICLKGFTTKRYLKTHLRVHTGEKPYKCDICQSSFSQINSLKTHIRIHTGEKPYKCNICHSSFNQKINLKIHIRTHTGEKPYKCDICQSSFSHKNCLQIHISTHTGEKPYKCDVCQSSFSLKHNLKTHIRIHTGEKPYKCDICQSSFSHKNCLQIHISTHTGEKPYKCDVCQSSFSLKHHLKTHIRIHTGEKPYKCDICQSSFNQKINLKRHIRTHTGEKPYKCDICQHSFSQINNLKTHIRIHTREKPYKCDICQSGFSRKHHLKSHIIRTHTVSKKF